MMPNTMYQHLAQRIQQMTGQPHYSAAMQSQDSQMFSRLHRDRLCLETQLHDETFTLPMLEFYVFVCAWLLHLADPEDRGLPLAKEVPAAFGSVPEYVVEDVAEFFTFISNVVPEHLEMLRVRHTIPSTFRHFVFLSGDSGWGYHGTHINGVLPPHRQWVLSRESVPSICVPQFMLTTVRARVRNPLHGDVIYRRSR